MTYLDIGHGDPSYGPLMDVIPFYLARGEDDIVYLEPGQTHDDHITRYPQVRV